MAFLKTETEVNVRSAMEFYKDTLTYTTDEKTIFFVDNDFTYIRELKQVFPGVIILLCNIHTLRYFEQNVLSQKATWEKETVTCLVSEEKKENRLIHPENKRCRIHRNV